VGHPPRLPPEGSSRPFRRRQAPSDRVREQL
ncbi:hypothetical protein BN1708_020477, partial [Verticillium longisporum]